MPRFGKVAKGSAAAPSAEDAVAVNSSPDQELIDRLQREAELEQRKQYATAAKRRLRADLQREATYTATNKLKIQNNWRKIMRLAKVESLRKDIEVISQNHERDVDRKDAVVQMLDRDLEESEEQYQMALRSHLQNIDILIDLQDARLLALENNFEADLRTLEDEFNAEREEIEKQHASEKTELLDVMSAVETEERYRETEQRHEHEQTREEIRNRNTEEINALRITLESQIEELERHFESAHLNYLQNTDQRTQDFKFLTTQDQTLSRDIEVKILKIERLQQNLAYWRSKIGQNNRECMKRNNALKQEKDAILQHFQELKSRMTKFRQGESRRLLDLTQHARKTKAHLNQNLDCARSVLASGENARQLETEREQIIPYKKSISDDGDVEEALSDEAKRELEKLRELMAMCRLQKREDISPEVAESLLETASTSSKGDGSGIEEWQYLDNFYKRFNEVLMDKLESERERARLRQENRELQGILKQYIDGISVSEETLRNPNPLLVVNGRTNMRQRPVRLGRPPVVEGNFMVNTGRAHTQHFGN